MKHTMQLRGAGLWLYRGHEMTRHRLGWRVSLNGATLSEWYSTLIEARAWIDTRLTRSPLRRDEGKLE